ncbi:hypothetical protein DPPLL_10780 [Desulfofustis limnaeus]|jgi:phospholipid-binding lipoprotein MlaA|uniref:VacJ family lipoprotein n=2 Tax=Desulfofustis limnaeus TaxID=2740163 RepID=A0ABN6M561_9BACT|nr:hypothetical protein DPPLL_10780 [Desulfofustis limnaeus]
MKMLRLILGLFIVLQCGAEPVRGAEFAPGPEQTFPDLLSDEPEEGVGGPDLLRDEPFIIDPSRIMGDPLFEDDYTLSPPPLLVRDPLEPFNRFVFEVNDRLYFWVFKPVKNVYADLLPEDIRQCLGNFFANLTAPIHFVNNVLQGEMEDAGIVLGRFFINTTIGVFGLGDPAGDEFGIKERDADFGQTLGKWGVGEGIYICWPGLGPSTARDSVGFLGDFYLHPVFYYSAGDTVFNVSYVSLERVNILSTSPDVYEELKRISLDPYVAARQAYYEYRRKVINER